MNSLAEFVWEHREDNPLTLALSGAKHPGIPVAEAARQVEALQKLRKKFPEWYRPGLLLPPLLSLEQASSSATARFKAGLFSGRSMADLTGGMGVDAFFLAGRFDEVAYVEQDPAVYASAIHNFQVMGRSNIRGSQSTAADFLATRSENFDLIYLDPARRHDQKGKVFQLSDCSPDILQIKNVLLERAHAVMVKTAPMLDIQLAMRQLESVSKVWIVEYEKECREVLYLLEKTGTGIQEAPVEVVMLNENGELNHSFSINYDEEKGTAVTTAIPGAYLYEPAPGIMKSGAFKTFGKRFGLAKLHANTHLYTSETMSPDLPARIFRIVAICPYDRKQVAAVISGNKANTAVRNFPDNAQQVKKRLGLQDGGEWYLFATTLINEDKAILICRKA